MKNPNFVGKKSNLPHTHGTNLSNMPRKGVSHLSHRTPPLSEMLAFMMPGISKARPKLSPSLSRHIFAGGPLKFFFMCLEASMWDNKFVEREAKGATDQSLFETRQQL